jgi:predicted PhzF superfamily epimerase YddE/YHI9
MLSMSLPADAPTSYSGPDVARALGDALGVAAPEEVHSAKYLFAVWKDAATIRAMTPTGDVAGAIRASGKWALIATAQDDGKHDFVSRFFAPDKGILEDPVTGSAHCTLTPFWAKRLGKKQLRAFQASKRGGELLCTDEGERVSISGNCALYMRGEIAI